MQFINQILTSLNKSNIIICRNIMNELKTLADLPVFLQQEFDKYVTNVVALIVDVTRPVYRQKQNNYVIEVKIMDDTINNFKIYGSLIRYASIYIFSQNKSDLDLFHQIGDIVYFHKFTYSFWNKVKLESRYIGTIDGIYCLKTQQFQGQQMIKIGKQLSNQKRKLPIQMITMRTIQLKQWVQYNYKAIFNPYLGIQLINNFCALADPFNLILKIQSHQIDDIGNRLILNDSNMNIFYLDFTDFRIPQLKAGQFVFIRSVKNVNNISQINLTETGNVLLLPDFMKQFQNSMNYIAVYKKTQKMFKSNKKVNNLTHVTFQNDKFTTIKQLLELQEKYRVSLKKSEVMVSSHYLVKVAVVKYKGALKKYHNQFQMILNQNFLNQLSPEERKQTLDQNKISYIYEGELVLIDQSSTTKKQLLKCYTFTNQPKATFFDPKLLQKISNNVGHSNQKQLAILIQNQINNKLQKLFKFSNFQEPVSLILEPIKSDLLVFRIVNTKIL